MSGWLEGVLRIAAHIEGGIDRVRYGFRRRFLPVGRVRIVTYRSFGAPDQLRVLGRVLRDPPPHPANEGTAWWRNVRDTFRRLESDEVPRARIRARLDGVVVVGQANEEGYFDLPIPLPSPLPRTATWHEVPLELVDPTPPGPPVTNSAPVLVPPLTATVGVISDIDDTVVRTEATQKVRMVRNVFLHNAHTRLPFEGVAAFYRALHAGAGGSAGNPLFFVSSSPWNLYDVLVEFLELHRIPRGPLLLRDWGLDPHHPLPTRHADHKLAAIRAILAQYPHLPFILIGDSGQEDPEIYTTVTHEAPGRILATYIRNVTDDPERRAAVGRLGAELAATGGVLLLVDDTITAARHAAEAGWIAPESLPEIGAETARDKGMK